MKLGGVSKRDRSAVELRWEELNESDQHKNRWCCSRHGLVLVYPYLPDSGFSFEETMTSYSLTVPCTCECGQFAAENMRDGHNRRLSKKGYFQRQWLFGQPGRVKRGQDVKQAMTAAKTNQERWNILCDEGRTMTECRELEEWACRTFNGFDGIRLELAKERGYSVVDKLVREQKARMTA